MNRPELPPELQRVCWCPACARELSTAPSIDPWVLCLACPARHRFFVELEVGGRASASAADAAFPELARAEHDEVALFWLSDPRARAILNMQVAQILRAVLEKRAPEQTTDARYCPICATALNEGAVSVKPHVGLLCSTKHEWLRFLRSLSNVTGVKQAFVLHAELSRQGIVNLVHAWLDDEGDLRSNLPPSVRAVLVASEFAREPVHLPAP